MNRVTYIFPSISYSILSPLPFKTKTPSPSQVLCFLYCGFLLEIDQLTVTRTSNPEVPLNHPHFTFSSSVSKREGYAFIRCAWFLFFIFPFVRDERLECWHTFESTEMK